MSVTASPALITASCAAATNDRPAGNRRNSDVCDKNTRRGGSSLGITHSIPALTQREDTNSSTPTMGAGASASTRRENGPHRPTHRSLFTAPKPP